jgi:hypothetical protein
MAIFTSETNGRALRCYRISLAWSQRLAPLVVALGMLVATAEATNTSTKEIKAARTDAAKDATANDGCVLCNGIRLQDEIDLVNVRSVCGSCDPKRLRDQVTFETFAIHDEPGYRRWQKSDLDSYLAVDASVPTIIFVHGNQITSGEAKSEGLAVYRKIILQGCDAPKIRFVIFSWPSAKVSGLLRDVRIKAARTGAVGCQLAWLVDQMPPETPVSLVGFSFGARIITGGLHILGGGSLGSSLVLHDRVHPDRAPINVALMASALDSYWLAKGAHHGQAMTQVNRMLLINNCEDRAMRYYDMLTPGRGGPQALGLCGPTRIDSESSKKIFNRDVSRYVGANHDLMGYICAPGDAAMIWDFAGVNSSSKLQAAN